MGIHAANFANACHSCGDDTGGTGTSLFLGNFATLANLSILHPDPVPGSWALITVDNGPDDVAIWDVSDDAWKNIGQNNLGKVYGLSLAGDGPIVLTDVLALLNAGTYNVEPFHAPVYFRVSRYNAGTYRTNIFNFLGGRGKWGLSGTAFTALNTMYLSTLPTTVSDILEEDIIALGAVADEEGFLAAANAEERDFTDDSQSYYFSYTIVDVLYIALFTSTNYQIYGGESFYQFVSGDFAVVTNSTVTATPSYQETLSVNPLSTIPAIHQTGPYKTTKAGDGIVVAYSDGLEYEKEISFETTHAILTTDTANIITHPILKNVDRYAIGAYQQVYVNAGTLDAETGTITDFEIEIGTDIIIWTYKQL